MQNIERTRMSSGPTVDIYAQSNDDACVSVLGTHAGLWLGEAAQQLLWCVEYELPSMHTEASSLRKLLQSLERRHEESIKSSKAAAGRYKRECGQLNLAGNSLESELQAAVLSLPQRLQSSVDALQCSSLKEVARIYVQQTESCTASHGEQLPALNSLLANTIEPVDAPNLAYLSSAHVQPEKEYTTDVEYRLDNSEAVLDLDLPVPQASADASHVDTDACESTTDHADEWGITSVQQGDAELCVSVDPEAITCTDSAREEPAQQRSTDEEIPSINERGAATSRIAFDDTFRAQLMADLYEIQAFCSRKVEEAEARESVGVVGVLLHGGEQAVTQEDCRDAMSAISGLLGSLQARPDVQMILRVSTSKVFAARLLRQLTLGKYQVRSACKRPLRTTVGPLIFVAG